MTNHNVALENLALLHHENKGELPNIANRLLFDADRSMTEPAVKDVRSTWTIADCERLLTTTN